MGFKNFLGDYKKICIEDYNSLKIKLVATISAIITLSLLGIAINETSCANNLCNFRETKQYKFSLEQTIKNKSSEKGLIIIDDNFMKESADYKVSSDYVPNLLDDFIKKQNYKVNDFSLESDKILLARLIFGEARFCSDKEKIAVAHTVLNRLKQDKKHNGKNKIRGIILKSRQYSCFNEDDPSIQKLKDPMQFYPNAFKKCLKISEGLLNGKYGDITNGATHYFNPKYMKPKGRYPTWANDLKRIGRIKVGKGKYTAHIFYK